MITIDHQDNLVSVTVLGEFTLGDFREFEELARYKIRFQGPVNLLLDLREMASFTVDMAWEEIRFSRAHSGDFERIGVLTGSQWLAWSAWINQLFVDADVEVFDDETEARNWINA
ncbi:MAG: STAS/SEC14 domain-containing protein [Proteobacteria bacterium]|nr:STAS/SEC14 domain-containing protein [Pseudomonadota bacterium]HQR03156.1 STAS/SEC14 domain-containing protein [Rhodocyclaceae bacterium]